MDNQHVMNTKNDMHLSPAFYVVYTKSKVVHYNDVIMSAVDSQITSLAVVYSTVYLGTDQINIKAPRHWPLCGEFTGDRWILRTKGQLRGKCFHLMTSSWFGHLPLQHHDTISGFDNVASKQHTHWSIQPAWCPYTMCVVIASPGSGVQL